MSRANTPTDFRAIYHVADVYERVLLPHYFDGIEDIELVARLMRCYYGHPHHNQRLNILDLGCGTGRVTEVLAPYAANLYGVDSAEPMIAAFRERFPHARAERLDTRAAVDALHAEGHAGTFDVVGVFWSLNYPVLDLFEHLTADGIRPRTHPAQARADAEKLVQQVVDLLAPNGHLIVLFFDSETPEQRLVTRLWERIAPFPGTGRGYPREIVTNVLATAERRGDGRVLHVRRGGLAVAPNPRAARDWFETVHLKSFPALVSDPDVRAEIDSFISAHVRPSGRVLIPAGVHLIDFWKIDKSVHVPDRRAS